MAAARVGTGQVGHLHEAQGGEEEEEFSTTTNCSGAWEQHHHTHTAARVEVHMTVQVLASL